MPAPAENYYWKEKERKYEERPIQETLILYTFNIHIQGLYLKTNRQGIWPWHRPLFCPLLDASPTSSLTFLTVWCWGCYLTSEPKFPWRQYQSPCWQNKTKVTLIQWKCVTNCYVQTLCLKKAQHRQCPSQGTQSSDGSRSNMRSHSSAALFYWLQENSPIKKKSPKLF